MSTIEEVLQLHKNSIRDFGGSAGIEILIHLKVQLSDLFNLLQRVELYPSAFAKSAAILQSIIKNRSFINGNKRTGFLAAFTLLYRSGIILAASEKDAYDFVVNVASFPISFEEIVSRFSENMLWLLINKITSCGPIFAKASTLRGTDTLII